MSSSITSSTPKIYYQGTNDQSVSTTTGTTTTLPLHRPLIMFFGEKGDTTPRWIDPAKFSDLYGSNTVDLNGAYATHSTPFLQEAISAGNQFLAMKLEPADIPEAANIGLSVDWILTKVPEYTRNTDGTYTLDTSGNKIPTGSSIDGIKMKFIFAQIGDDTDGVSLIGNRVESEGTLGDDTTKSTITPLIDFAARYKGALGPNTALRIWAPTINSTLAADEDLQTTLSNFLYRFQLLTRTDASSSPTMVTSYYGDTSLSVALGTNVIDPDTDIVYDFAERVEGQYNSTDADTWMSSPIAEPSLYDANIAKLLTSIQGLESTYGTVSSDTADLYTINLFGGQTVEAVPYHSVQILGASDGGDSLSETASHYLLGGGNGTMSNDTFNTAAALVLSNISSDNAEFNLSNMARYPFNAFWDSGFDQTTKLLIPSIIGFRADTWIALSTQDIEKADNSNEVEESIAVALLTRVQQFPDSSDFATPAFRGMIVGGVGEYTEVTRKTRVPLTLDRFRAWCRYAGAANGILKSSESIDGDTNRKVLIVKNISNLDKSWRVRRTMWNSALVYVEDYDTNSQFYPGQQSFYSTQGSVLRAAIVGFLVANINRFAFNAWRDLSGQQGLTDDQLIERSETIVSDAGASAFDNRMIYTPVASITDADKDRGYSWTMRVDFGANSFRTVMDFSTVAYTREELASNGQ